MKKLLALLALCATVSPICLATDKCACDEDEQDEKVTAGECAGGIKKATELLNEEAINDPKVEEEAATKAAE
jgi:hypothetical protein